MAAGTRGIAGENGCKIQSEKEIGEREAFQLFSHDLTGETFKSAQVCESMLSFSLTVPMASIYKQSI